MELPGRVGLHGVGDAVLGLRLARGFGVRRDGGNDGVCGRCCGGGGVGVSVVLACSTGRCGAFPGEIGVLELRGGFGGGGRRRDHCSGLRDAGCDGWVGGCGLGADGLADRALRIGLGAAVGLARSRSQAGLRSVSAPSAAGAAGAVSAASEAEAAIAAAAIASGAVALSVAWVRGSRRCRRCGSRDWQRQWRRPSPRPFHPAPSRSDPLPRSRRRKCLLGLVGLRAIGLRRIGLRFGAAGRRSLGVGIGLGIGIGLAVYFPSSRALSPRALAAALRSFESLRAALSMLPCPMRRRCRASGCRTRLAHRRSGAGRARESWARLSLLLAAALLSTSAAKLSFRADGSESGRADLAAAL